MRKGYRLQVVGYSIVALLFFLFTVPSTLYPAHAADSSPSAEIKVKLEELKKEIASKAAKLKLEVGRKLKDKAYSGKVKSKSDTTLTLSSNSGPKVVSINQDTVFENKNKAKKKLSQASISEEDYIAALGDTDETGVLTAKKVILLPPPSLEPKTFLWSKVISISGKLTTLKTSDSKNITAILPNSSGAKVNDFIILTGNKDKNDIFEAGFVYVITQGGIIKPKKAATPSAQVATPSAKNTPKPTPKPKPASR